MLLVAEFPHIVLFKFIYIQNDALFIGNIFDGYIVNFESLLMKFLNDSSTLDYSDVANAI